MFWARQIFSGLAHMHSMKMTHRDLHMANIMIENKNGPGAKQFVPSTGKRAIRIIDYGWYLFLIYILS
jgi:serine/threonine protein kinase